MSDNKDYIDLTEIQKMFEERDRRRAAEQRAKQNANSQSTVSGGYRTTQGGSRPTQIRNGENFNSRNDADNIYDYVSRTNGSYKSNSQSSSSTKTKTSSAVRGNTANRQTYASNRNDGYSSSSSKPLPSYREYNARRKKQLKRKIFVRRVSALGAAILIIGGSVLGIHSLKKNKNRTMPIENPPSWTENVQISDKGDVFITAAPEPVETENPTPNEMGYLTKFNNYSHEQLMDYKNPEFTYMSNFGGQQYLFANDDYIMQICNNVVDVVNGAAREKGYKELPEGFAAQLFGIAIMESSGRIEDSNGNVLAPSVGGSARGMFQMQPGAATDALRFLKSLGLDDYFGLSNENLEDECRRNPYKEAALAGGVFSWIYNSYCSKVDNSIDMSKVSDGCENNWIYYAYNQGVGNLERSLWGNEKYYNDLLGDAKTTNAREKADAKVEGFYEYINSGYYPKTVITNANKANNEFLHPVIEYTMGD